MLPVRYQLVISGFVVAAGVFFVVMGAISTLQGRALLSRGVVADAELTGVTDRDEDSDTGHQVRYRLRVGGREYRREGIFGTEVGSDVTAEEQARAMATGRIQVRYLPEDPSVNEPVAHARPQAEKGWIAMGVGLLMSIGGSTRLVLAWLRSRRRA